MYYNKTQTYRLKFALEKEKGLPTLDMMDPTKTNIASSQVGFIRFLCLGLFEQITRVFPAMQSCVVNVVFLLFSTLQGTIKSECRRLPKTSRSVKEIVY